MQEASLTDSTKRQLTSISKVAMQAAYLSVSTKRTADLW